MPLTNPQLIGESQAHFSVLDRISALAPLDRPTLVTGERGTGKQLYASRLHFLSPRWERPYSVLNCASLPEDQADRMLFGVENDGLRSLGRVGRIESSDGGTVFLDEVDALSPRLQEKLLRVIEYGEFERVDGDETVSSDVRIIAATSLRQAEALPHLRADLLDRLAFGVVHLPPLRERRDDISALTLHFGKAISADLGLERFPGFTAEAMETLFAHRWPGNVRELKTVVGRSVGLATIAREQMGEDPLAPIGDVRFATTLTPSWAEEAHDPQPELEADAGTAPDTSQPDPPIPDAAAPVDFTSRVAAFETRLIEEALRATGGHQGRAAEHLGLTYHQFRGLLKRHGFKK